MVPFSKPAIRNMPHAAPHVSRIRPMPPPKAAPIRRACCSVKPYISAKAATTDCEQLYPLLKRATAFSTLSSIFSFMFYFQQHRTVVGMHSFVQNSRSFQHGPHRFCRHAIINPPSFVLGP